jgi:hypothetical protein
MYMGRLEIIPVLLLILPGLWKKGEGILLRPNFLNFFVDAELFIRKSASLGSNALCGLL